MKRKRIIPFLSLLFVAPFFIACGDSDKDYYDYYDDFKTDCVLLDNSDPLTNSYRITYENTGDCYLHIESYDYDDIECHLMRDNEPFYEPFFVIAPGEKETFYIELSKDHDLDTFLKARSAYTTRDDNVEFEHNPDWDSFERHEKYDALYLRGQTFGLDDDYDYSFYLNVSYQGRDYNVYYGNLTGYVGEILYEPLKLNKNTNLNDLQFNNIIAFKYGPRSERINGRNLLIAFLIIGASPFVIVALIKLIIVSISVIVIKVKEKRNLD